MDPVPLSNFSQKVRCKRLSVLNKFKINFFQFLTASITLKNGTLKGISSLVRNNDVKVSYSRNDLKLTIDLPINLKNINVSILFSQKSTGNY